MSRTPSSYAYSAQRSNKPLRKSLGRSPFAIAGAALILTACGGGGGGGSGNVSPFTAGQTPVSGGEFNGELVQSGQYAGLNQDCVDTLLAIDPNGISELIQLSCRPENIEVDSSSLVNAPTEDDVTEDEPTEDAPVTQLPLTPPETIPGLNIAQPDVSGGNYYPNSRVSALLTGSVFGAGSSPNADLVKPLAVQIDIVEPGLELLELRAVRDSSRGDTADFIGVVQNTSSEFLCSITLDEVSAFSSTGAEFSSDSLEFALLSGEIGVGVSSFDGNPFYFPSCLAAGSLGYMLSYRDVSFDSVAEVRAEELRSSSGRAQFDGEVVPVSYSVESDGSVSIIIVNNSSEPLSVFSVDAIAIDEQGHAFAWDSELPLSTVEPGAELVVDNIFPRFKGRASTIRAIVDFDGP